MNTFFKLSILISFFCLGTPAAHAIGETTSGNFNLAFPLTIDEGAPNDGTYNKTIHYDFDSQYIDQITVSQDQDGQPLRRVVRVNCGQVAARMAKYLIYREMVRIDLGNGYQPYVFRDRPNRYRQSIIAYNLGNITARAGRASFANATSEHTAEGHTLAFGNLDIFYRPIAGSYQYRPETCGDAIDCELNLQIYYCGMSELAGNMSQAFTNLVNSVAANQVGLREETIAARQRTANAAVSTAEGQALITVQPNHLIEEDVPPATSTPATAE